MSFSFSNSTADHTPFSHFHRPLHDVKGCPVATYSAPETRRLITFLARHHSNQTMFSFRSLPSFYVPPTCPRLRLLHSLDSGHMSSGFAGRFSASFLNRWTDNNAATTSQRPGLATAGSSSRIDFRAQSATQNGGATEPPANNQRVVAHSTTTGCLISAPISPPAHYPGFAGSNSRRSSVTRTSSDYGATSGARRSTSATRTQNIPVEPPAAPRWAHPPLNTNKISGRAWSFSQGQERPDVDFDPELFNHAEPDAVEEILKGVEGRIAVMTTPNEYSIMAWLPGFR